MSAATGGTMVERARRLGLSADWDFLLHLPMRYVDETRIVAVGDLHDGDFAQVEGEITDCRIEKRRSRQLVARLRDDSGELTLRFLHFHDSLRQRLASGARLRVLGAVREGFAGCEMVHPRIRTTGAGDALPGTYTPVYPAGEGLAQPWLRRRIERAMAALPERDALDPSLLGQLGLMPLPQALRTLHQPAPDEDFDAIERRSHPAWRRLLLDELLAQQLALRQARARRTVGRAPVLQGDGRQVSALLASLPFRPTTAQARAWGEIEADLALARPMNRLLQGDVGSGKTLVAALAAVRAVEAGWQAAFMAPTEILAEQHLRGVGRWLEPLGIRTAWLAGRQRDAARREALGQVASGEAGVVVGTHALIQSGVRFARLGLAVIDEQHRFGVDQRIALGSTRTDGAQPHVLMMSATPIPRSLALSYLADLDVSTIDELPPGRSPVRTKLISGARRDEVLARVRDEAARGRQAYWVCPLVEENDELEATAAVEMVERTREALPELRLGLLHGQMPAAAKAAVMQAFRDRETDVLVATTVIEVGVDVPNASLMVVEHAQRFGLATLHQLRGRVGRGSAESTCVLLFDEPLSALARERLRVLYESTDGFEIARRDLELRGPGEVLGARQWGLAGMRYADPLRDTELLESARTQAQRLLDAGSPEAAALPARWFGDRLDRLGL